MCCTGGAGEADEGAAKLPGACGGRRFTRAAPPGSTGRPPVRPETPSGVPVTGWAPVLLKPPLPGSGDDGVVESRGTKAPVLCRNPGHTNASSSSAASSPAPAAADLRATAVPAVPTEATRRRAASASRGRASSGTARKPSVTCSFSSVPASIGSSSGAHRPMQSSRRPWQVPHWLRCRVTVTRRAAGNTAVCRRPPSCQSLSR